jgi:cytoskeleton protein RodZ
MSSEVTQSAGTDGVAEVPGQVIKPGRLLLAARERQNLTAPDIAARLNLDLRVITALENDRYDELRVPAYVRGYIRAYARQVGVNPDELVRAYDRVAEQAPPLHPFQSRPAAQADSSHDLVQLVSVVVVVLLVGLSLAWWWNREQPTPTPAASLGEETPAVTEPAVPTVGTASAAAGAYSFPIVDHSTTAPAADAGVPAPLPGYVPEPAAVFTPPDEQPAEEPAAEVTERVEAEAAEPAAAVEDADVVLPGDELESPAATTTATDLPPALVAGQRNLTLGLKGQAWVEIYDADGKRLYFNMARAGQTIATSGKPPLKVTIGNIAVAELAVDGALVEMAPLATEGVARLVVTAEGVERARRNLED